MKESKPKPQAKPPAKLKGEAHEYDHNRPKKQVVSKYK